MEIPTLPDPYLTTTAWFNTVPVGSGQDLGSGALITLANRACYVPVIFPCDVTVYSLMFQAANGTGNYDLGLYDGNLNLMTSSGSTAMSAAGTKTLSIPNWRIRGGTLYYAALSFSSISGQLIRWQNSALGWGAGGVGAENSALPLPSTATPVVAIETVIPVFAFGVR